MTKAPDPSGGPGKVLALLPWGSAIEDFLDTLGVSLDTFCGEMPAAGSSVTPRRCAGQGGGR